jgi:hypothetical protein
MSTKPAGKKPVNTKFNAQVQKEKNKKKKQKRKRIPATTIMRGQQVPINRPETQLAPGVNTTVSIRAVMCPEGVQTMFTGLISIALSGGAINTIERPIWWAYLGLLRDFKLVCQGKIGSAVVRLHYLNEIYAAFFPKSVPFGTGQATYSFVGLESIAEESNLSIDGYSYLFYVPNGQDEIFGNHVYIAPSLPSSDDDIDAALEDVLTVLSTLRRSELFRLIRNPTLGKTYMHDTSPFARSSPYHGSGSCTSGGPWSSAESEVPFKSRTLTVFCEYSESQTRSSRVLKANSGDTCYAITCPAMPKYELGHYDTAFPAVFKFIDFDEIFVVALAWMCESVEKYLQTANAQPDFFLQQFPSTLADFYIALRQQVLTMFGNSQASVQYMSSDVGPSAFKAFRQGTNCFAQVNDDAMKLPVQLLENLRFLTATAMKQTGGRFNNPRNVKYLMPVLGRYPANILEMPQCKLWDGNQFISQDFFLPPGESAPDPIDGRLGTNFIDLNGVQYRNLIIQWNNRVEKLSGVCGKFGVTSDEGATFAPLLTLTRYNGETNTDVLKMSSLQLERAPARFREHVEKLKREKERTKEVNRTKSLPKATEIQNYPAGTSLFQIETSAVSSYAPISGVLKGYIKYLILPQICIRTSNFDLSEIQVESQEPYKYQITPPNTISATNNNRYQELLSIGRVMAPGIANPGSTELDRAYAHLAEKGVGGFLGDILSGAGQIAGFFGF